MIHEDQVFVVDVVVINSTWETVVTSVICRPIGATAKFSVIVNIRKYRRLHEGHHFISTAMEVHNALGRDMDRFIKECASLFHNRWSGGHLSLSF
jgi:hypothetical protein